MYFVGEMEESILKITVKGLGASFQSHQTMIYLEVVYILICLIMFYLLYMFFCLIWCTIMHHFKSTLAFFLKLKGEQVLYPFNIDSSAVDNQTSVRREVGGAMAY